MRLVMTRSIPTRSTRDILSVRLRDEGRDGGVPRLCPVVEDGGAVEGLLAVDRTSRLQDEGLRATRDLVVRLDRRSELAARRPRVEPTATRQPAEIDRREL